MLKSIAVAFLALSFLAAQTTSPERKVAGNVISSERDPKVQIRLPGSVQYLGADRWVLYKIADCELHAFVDTDARKNIERLYWIQFEGYLPTKPDLAHKYDSPRHATIGGLDFYVDTWTRADGEETRAGSDREHIEALIRARGYKMPLGMMYVRLVHLIDEKKRKELMIIYGEELAPTGFAARDLQENGKAHSEWPAIEKGLIERAEKAITLSGP
jgi:hypothetical protein